MAKRRKEPKERKVVATIRSGKKKESLESWKFWEIVEVLQFMGADRIAAYDAAKLAGRAKPGVERTVTETITMEVQET